MTFEEQIKTYLYSLGIFEDQIQGIVKQLKEDTKDTMGRRWDDDRSGYPDVMQGVLMLQVHLSGLKYFEKNHPSHFLIPYFKGEIIPKKPQ